MPPCQSWSSRLRPDPCTGVFTSPRITASVDVLRHGDAPQNPRPEQGRYYEEHIPTVIQPGEIETLAYGEFLSDLKTHKPIYIFNYDWRQSAVTNGERLGQFLDYLQGKSAAAKATKRLWQSNVTTIGAPVLVCSTSSC